MATEEQRQQAKSARYWLDHVKNAGMYEAATMTPEDVYVVGSEIARDVAALAETEAQRALEAGEYFVEYQLGEHYDDDGNLEEDISGVVRFPDAHTAAQRVLRKMKPKDLKALRDRVAARTKRREA